MRTVLGTTARRRTLVLALAAGLSGAVALPAAAATHRTPARHHRSGHVSVGPHGGGGPVVLGPAVKYVREPDGTVRRVR